MGRKAFTVGALLFSLVGVGLAARKPLPPAVCNGHLTEKALLFIENGVLNCSDGPLYDLDTSTSLDLDGIQIAVTTDGNLTFSNLKGVGNALVCADKDGKLYRGAPNC